MKYSGGFDVERFGIPYNVLDENQNVVDDYISFDATLDVCWCNLQDCEEREIFWFSRSYC